MYRLSVAALCERWLEIPYFQYLCGEAAFRHELPFDRSSLSRWRRRLAGAPLDALLQVARNAADPAQAGAAEGALAAGRSLGGGRWAGEGQRVRAA